MPDPNQSNTTAEPWPPKIPVCVGTVVIKDGRVLLVRQAKGASFAGQWSIPWGLVESGEAPEQAALRETLEESGITSSIDGLLGIQNLPSVGWIGIIFLCRHISGEPAPDGIETDLAAYFSHEEILSFGEPIEPWCDWLAQRVLLGQYTVIPENPGSPYSLRKAFI